MGVEYVSKPSLLHQDARSFQSATNQRKMSPGPKGLVSVANVLFLFGFFGKSESRMVIDNKQSGKACKRSESVVSGRYAWDDVVRLHVEREVCSHFTSH